MIDRTGSKKMFGIAAKGACFIICQTDVTGMLIRFPVKGRVSSPFRFSLASGSERCFLVEPSY